MIWDYHTLYIVGQSIQFSINTVFGSVLTQEQLDVKNDGAINEHTVTLTIGDPEHG